METVERTAAKRRFTGLRGPPLGKAEDLAAVADVLLSSPARPAASDPPAASEAPAAAAPAGRAAVVDLAPPPSGLYLLIPAGIDAADRRRTALAVASRLAPQGGTAALVVIEGGRADAHILGEPGCGRLGPQNYLASADAGRTVTDLVDQCDQVAVILVDSGGGAPGRLGGLAWRAVFVAGSDAESLVETYRELKCWRARGARGEASLFVVGGDGAAEAARVHGRLRTAAQRFLGCRLAIQGFLPAGDAACPAGAQSEPLRVLAQAPAEQIWPHLVAARAPAAAPPVAAPDVAAQPAGPGRNGRAVQADAAPQAVAPAPSVEACGVFSAWTPDDRSALVAAIEAQAPALLGGSLRQVFRVDVDEPGAPPLAAVRADGALVAILLRGDGPQIDTQAAGRWLALHRSLLARAYPRAGIEAGGESSAIVLAPLESPPADGVRRFLPVKLGGHRGVVLLP